MYLSHVEFGGETVFPDSEVRGSSFEVFFLFFFFILYAAWKGHPVNTNGNVLLHLSTACAVAAACISASITIAAVSAVRIACLQRCLMLDAQPQAVLYLNALPCSGVPRFWLPD